jgi:hypothetical protein
VVDRQQENVLDGIISRKQIFLVKKNAWEEKQVTKEQAA